MNEGNAAPVLPQTTTEYAYRALRTAIANGELTSGHRVVQRDWAERLGISVTPVREALNRLSSDGLVTVSPHRGATIIGLRLEDAEEIYRLRVIVDPLLVPKQVELFTPERLQSCLRLCELMESAASAVEFSELNQSLHQQLSEGITGWTAFTSAQLRMAAAPYVALTLRFDVDRMRESNKDHYELLDALTDADVHRAEAATVKHMTDSLKLLRQAFAAHALAC